MPVEVVVGASRVRMRLHAAMVVDMMHKVEAVLRMCLVLLLYSIDPEAQGFDCCKEVGSSPLLDIADEAEAHSADSPSALSSGRAFLQNRRALEDAG